MGLKQAFLVVMTLFLAAAVGAQPYDAYAWPGTARSAGAAGPGSWYYDPYTTLVPCPQWSPSGTTPCPASNGE